jgi:hypothetical protein
VALYTFFHPGLRRGGDDEGEGLDEGLDQGVPALPEERERVSEVVRFPS